MKKASFLVCGLWSLVFCLSSSAEVYVYTNNVLSLSPSAHPLTFTKDLPARYTVFARQGSTAVNLSDYSVTWVIRDLRDNEPVGFFPAEIRDATNGHVIVRASFAGWEAGTYRGQLVRYLNETNAAGNLSDDFIYIQERCIGCPDVFTNTVIAGNIESGAVQVAVGGPTIGVSNVTVATMSVRSWTGDYIGAVTGAYVDLNVTGNLTVDGTLNVGESIEALDSTKVLKVGETNTVDLSSTSVNVRWPTNATEAASKGYVDSVAGGELSVGTIQLYTNAAGQVGYTNRVGVFSALPGFALPGGNDVTWTYLSDYSDVATITSNRNIGGVTYYVTNNTLAGLLPNEAAGLRMIDYRPITSGTWVRAGVEWVQRPQRGKASSAGTMRNGIAWTTYANNTSYLFGAQMAGTTEPVWKHKIYASNFALQGDIFGNAPYDVTLQSFNLSEFPHATWDMVDYDGTGVVRALTAASDSHAPTMLQLMTNAAFGQPIMGFAIGLNSDAAATGRGTNTPWQVRRMIIQEGALWIDPSSRE